MKDKGSKYIKDLNSTPSKLFIEDVNISEKQNQDRLIESCVYATLTLDPKILSEELDSKTFEV